MYLLYPVVSSSSRIEEFWPPFIFPPPRVTVPPTVAALPNVVLHYYIGCSFFLFDLCFPLLFDSENLIEIWSSPRNENNGNCNFGCFFFLLYMVIYYLTVRWSLLSWINLRFLSSGRPFEMSISNNSNNRMKKGNDKKDEEVLRLN